MMRKKQYQELMLEVERLDRLDILTESNEDGSAPKLDDGVGDFYEKEF